MSMRKSSKRENQAQQQIKKISNHDQVMQCYFNLWKSDKVLIVQS